MSNLTIVADKSLSQLVVNHVGAAAVVGFTGFLTLCVMFDPDSHDSPEEKTELLKELYSAAYCTWKYYMGLGPKPEIKTGIPEENPKQLGI